jgi:hypothetical protein
LSYRLIQRDGQRKEVDGISIESHHQSSSSEEDNAESSSSELSKEPSVPDRQAGNEAGTAEHGIGTIGFVEYKDFDEARLKTGGVGVDLSAHVYVRGGGGWVLHLPFSI